MDPEVAFPHKDSKPRLRLDTLIRLRWLALAGQIVALGFGRLLLGLDLPLPACLGLILLSVAANLVLRRRAPLGQRLDERSALLHLSLDGLQLALLVGCTGGLANPFCLLLLVPVVISAASLSATATACLGAWSALLALVLAAVHLPLRWLEGGELALPGGYLFGIWLSLVTVGAFVSAYSFRVAQEGRRLQAALAATELILLREQHLNQLDGLAAAAAHELGTPLATITLVSKELLREVPAGSAFHEDLELLKSQSERCREILRKLSSQTTDVGGPLDRLPLSHLIEDMIAPHRDMGIALVIQLDGERASEPVGTRNPAILYGLGNILENAMDFARARVDVAASWDRERVAIVIRDDGPGFAPDILARIGDPYVTSRQRQGGDRNGPGGGLGLGFFIAKTLLERTGARLHISNRAAPEQGAVIRIEWPRAALDAADEAEAA